MSEKGGSHLLRVLGVAFGIAAVVGGTIGQGILRTPGLVASGVTNPKVIILLWVLGGIVAIIDAMSIVELAASIRRTGGPYAFVTRTFGRLPGLAVGLADWLGYVGVVAFLSVVFSEFLHRLGIAVAVPISVLALLVIVAMGSVQALGTRIGGASQEIASAFKAVIFIVLIVALLFSRHDTPVVTAIPTHAMTLVGLIIAIRAIVGTYLGWNQAAYYCEEVKDPGRSIARAIFSGLVLVMAIYVLVNVALLSVLTPAQMAGSPLAAADAAARVFGPSANTVVTAISLFSVISILNLSLMTFPRVLFAIARDAGVPGLSRVAKNGSPQVALIVMVVAAALLATIGIYEILLAFSVWLTTCVALSMNISAIAMRRREPLLERPYHMPLYPLPAIFAMLVNTTLLAAFLYESPMTAVRASVLLAVVTWAIYLATRQTALVQGEIAISKI
jgi:APA family basic amino acid/polyamine antiporter